MTAIIPSLNAFAASWFHFITRLSLEAAIALPLAAIFAALSRSGRIKSWWLRLAHFKLLITLLCITPVAIPLLPPDKLPQSPPSPTARANVPSITSTALPTTQRPPPQAARANVPSSTENPTDPQPLSPQSLLLLLWLLGLSLSTLRLARAFRRTQSLRHSAKPINDPCLLERTHQLARTLHLRTTPILLTSTEVPTPLVTGTFHPAILLPTSLPDAVTPQSLDLILTHELSHLARRDLLWNWLPALLTLPLFFHPLLWLARREWHAAQEIACDQLTLATTQSPPADYARTLLDVLANAPRARPGLFALGMGAFATTKRRIHAMSRNHSPSTPALTALALAAILGIAPWRLVAQSPQPLLPPVSNAAPKSTPFSVDSQPLPSPATPPTLTPPPPAPNLDNAPRYVATLSAQSVTLSASLDGTIQSVDAQEGQHVTQDKLLVKLNNRDQEIAVRLAQIELDSAKKQLQRSKQSGAVSDSDKDQAEATFERASIALEKANSDLEKTFIRSPIDGIVTTTPLVRGQFVSKGAHLLTVTDISKIYVNVDLPASALSGIHVGQKIEVETPQKAQAEITFISPVVETASGTCLVKATLESPSSDARPGMIVSVVLPKP